MPFKNSVPTAKKTKLFSITRTSWSIQIMQTYKSIILPVVLYGYETLSLTLREEHRLSVFQNRVLREIFSPKRDEVTGELSKLHNEELHILYASPDIIRQIKSKRIRWAGHVVRMGEERKAVMFRAVFWVVLPCKMIVDRRFRGAYCLHHQG
jgi:hypothetical protein